MGNCFAPASKKESLESGKWVSCTMDEFEKRVNPLIDNIKLDRYKRNILKKRFTKLVVFYENYSNDINFKYNICRIIISVGSMILPTLQTIQNNETVASIKDEIFWAAIGTSLSVMISNNLISMFSLDRRYIMYAVTAEKLKSIGWKYFELSDMFSGKTHIENWVMFWNEVEKIKKLQMIAEFTDNDGEKNSEPIGLSTNVIENNSDSDSDMSPRTPKSHRKKHHSPRLYSEEVVINLDKEQALSDVKASFKTKFENSDLGKQVNDVENKINEGIEMVEMIDDAVKKDENEDKKDKKEN